MIDCRFSPMKNWPTEPTPTWKRSDGQFKAGWQKTLDLLEKELNWLHAKDITVEGFFAAGDIRNDGWPKSSARPTQPGVVLSFETKRGRMVMPCDKYKHWESNLRAIALTLEHLRAVERHGVVSDRKEQYTGWLRLPAASSIDELAECAKILIRFASVGFTTGQVMADQNIFDLTWREAVRRTHPDTNEGRDRDDFAQVMTARDRMRELKGWR